MYINNTEYYCRKRKWRTLSRKSTKPQGSSYPVDENMFEIIAIHYTIFTWNLIDITDTI